MKSESVGEIVRWGGDEESARWRKGGHNCTMGEGWKKVHDGGRVKKSERWRKG